MSARPLPGRATAAASPATLAVSEGREFAWTNADFSRVQKLIYQRAGISLHDGKHAMVYSRLSRRLRDTGHTSFEEYLGWLESQDGPEWQEFINALTTNLTAFFREQHHFDSLTAILKKRPSGPWRIWCSAASTGEEPYSIVITVLQALGVGVPFELFASDIDTRVLETASRGVYRSQGLKGLTQEQLQRFFMRGKGNNDGLVRVRPEVRKPITFLSVNLIRDDWPFREPFDAVFCRNVMIYFDAPTQRRVLERIHRVMKPGGTLFVGHAENFSESRDLFVLRGKTVYERV
ncbi:CheR family methyltransferase [Comamonas sp. SCN 65-56]|uniref:CheR family methyltransferase n=1 Tax=Comamonas sp. SCN 65-56 TaxID=1660095 RepID=UPI000A435735|nr:CheR family methyltransferase [Comamonas sp. SCN 65-56]